MNITRKIEQYLDGTLNDKEKTMFEILADSYKKLAELIRLHKEVNDSIRDNDLQTLRYRLKHISENYFMSKSAVNNLMRHEMFRQKQRYLYH